ncbi:Hypothetical predicted protein, partial [Scomber scombrus]
RSQHGSHRGRELMDGYERSHMTKLQRVWKPGTEDGRFGRKRRQDQSCTFTCITTITWLADKQLQ